MSIIDEVSFGEDKMKIVCAWCKKVMVEGFEPISHSICPECQEKMDWEGINEYKISKSKMD